MDEQVDYTGYTEDTLNIAHAVQFLEPVPNQVEDPPERWKQDVRDQIRKRKQVMAGLAADVKKLEAMIE